MAIGIDARISGVCRPISEVRAAPLDEARGRATRSGFPRWGRPGPSGSYRQVRTSGRARRGRRLGGTTHTPNAGAHPPGITNGPPLGNKRSLRPRRFLFRGVRKQQVQKCAFIGRRQDRGGCARSWPRSESNAHFGKIGPLGGWLACGGSRGSRAVYNTSSRSRNRGKSRKKAAYLPMVMEYSIPIILKVYRAGRQ